MAAIEFRLERCLVLFLEVHLVARGPEADGSHRFLELAGLGFLSRFRGYLACRVGSGARLRREARDVRVGDRTIDVVSALTVRQARQFFQELTLSE